MKSLTKECLIIRADASAEIGIGHVMRCLALAQAWHDQGGKATFVMATKAPALETRLKLEGMELVHLPVKAGCNNDALKTASIAQKIKASWIAVDGYHFDADYQRIIKDSGLHLLFIDDNGHAEHYYADIVLNQNLHANEKLYKDRESYTKLLLGPKYVLLRREFLKWREWKREIPKVARKVLVTMGGGDPNNVTLKIIQALKQVKVDGLEAVVVIGGNNLHLEELQAAVQNSQTPICLESNVTDMPKLMAWADVAISGGGSTCWEMAFMGLPSILIATADNQLPVAEQLADASACVNLGWYEHASSSKIGAVVEELLRNRERRATMAKISQELVDGEGVDRVLMELKGETLRLRPVRKDDLKLLWKWANDSEVRAASFSSETIGWDEHVQWFESKLNDPRCFFYIAEDIDSTPIGQVRFEAEEKEATVSVSLDRAMRGKSYGSALIREAMKKIFENTALETINAYIKTTNKPSFRAFKKAGFDENGPTQFKGQSAIKLVRRRGVKK